LHASVARQRLDFQHKLAARLAQEFAVIAVEDLNILGLSRASQVPFGDSMVSKSVGDAAWGQFLRLLQEKVEERGGFFVKVDARNTSQTCPECGCIVEKPLSERQHHCPHCGYTAPRDVAAARVILNRGLNKIGPDRVAA